ncbi:MerR family transcriptional regulator [Litchfieldella rifensis]|uniref:Mercuric resistance operon regulatory protein n=1 Tax=Litchfieldella rifensis TaxID=762643 RepID=A0ABV7LRP1_9GAMM
MSATTISKAAQAAGVGVETIRFYERKGLIEQPPKPRDGGYRVYPDDTVRRVRFIRRAQQLGFSLREVADLLSLRLASHADASDVQRRAMAKLQDVDEKIARLQRIRRGLAELLARCPGEGALQCCSILGALEQEDISIPHASPHEATGNPSLRHDTRENAMQTVKLRIDGMHCDGCVEIVRHVLERQSGVLGCSVSHENSEARVAVDTTQVSSEQLAKAIEEAGYRARVT